MIRIPPNCDAVIFDMDGVLTDSEPLINEAAISLLKEYGVQAKASDFQPFVGTGENRYIGGVAEKYGVTLDISAAKHRLYEIYLALVPDKLQAFPGAVKLVRECRMAGKLTAVATSADMIKLKANLLRIDLPPEGWAAVVTAEDADARKPAPDLFLAAARTLNVPPGRCVVVEDAVTGIMAAKAAGMYCIAVAHTFPAAQLMQADVVVSSIADIAADRKC